MTLWVISYGVSHLLRLIRYVSGEVERFITSENYQIPVESIKVMLHLEQQIFMFLLCWSFVPLYT